MTYSVPFQRRTITLKVKNRIVGGTPTDPKLIDGWLKANMPQVTEEARAKLAATTLAEVEKTVEEESKGMWTTFKRDGGHLVLESRQLKAAFKEAANILRDVLQKQEKAGKKADAKESKSRFTGFRSKIAERLFVEGDKLTICDATTGEPLTSPTGTEERPIHVMTAQGERTALKKYDFCSNVVLKFTVRWLDDGLMDDALLNVLLEYMSWNGIGADRSQGEGQFELLSIKPA